VKKTRTLPLWVPTVFLPILEIAKPGHVQIHRADMNRGTFSDGGTKKRPALQRGAQGWLGAIAKREGA
jgi:hypothetical protein